MRALRACVLTVVAVALAMAAAAPTASAGRATIIPCSAAATRVTLTASARLDPACAYTGGFDITASNVTLDCRGALVDGTGRGGVGILVHHPPGLSALRSVLIGAWKQAPTLHNENQASLAGGPGGVYAMLISAPKGRCPCKEVFRRWNGTRFASPFDTQQDFTGTGASTGANHDLFQDRAGRLHAVWTKTRGQATQNPTDVRYARSKGGTADFAKPLTLTERGRDTNPVDLDLGTASDGLGFVAWEEGGDSATGSKSAVRAVAVSPSPQK